MGGFCNSDNRGRYCVLYTQVVNQERLRAALKKALPEGRGTVFYPCMECYRRDADGKIEVKAMFPGYVFIRSDMNARELYGFLKACRHDVIPFFRELGLSTVRAFDDAGIDGEDTYKLSDLTEKEAEFLDFLLDIDDTGGQLSKEAKEQVDRNGLPLEGLLKMSYGYKEHGEYKVMEGPLRVYENHIINVNRHDNKAFLDLTINGKAVRAGFMVRPKRYWFPDDEDAPEVFLDGTEIDLKAMARMMMGH